LDESEIQRLVEFDRNHIIHPQFHVADHRDAIIYASGEGAVLTDVHGNSYIDGLASLWNVAVGHGRAELADAAAEQMRTLAFSNAYTGYANEPSIRLTERLLERAYPNMSGIFYANSGSEANDFAIKAARYYWFVSGKPDKVKIISRSEAYHGGTLAATAITGMAPFHKGFGPEPPGFVQVPTCYPYRCQWCASKPSCTLECADNIADVIDREGADTVAAVIAEPVHGAGGVIPPDPGYWPRLREICDRYGVLLIADEVITGFGRTGRWFGLDHWGVRPDLLVAAKGATSGYFPFGFVAASAEVHDTVAGPGAAGFVHGFTFSHHAVGAAVAREVLRILEAEDLVAASASKGDRLRTLLRDRLGDHPNVGQIRGRGLMVGIELVADRETRAAFPRAAKVTEAVVRTAKSNGVLVYSGTGNANGVDGDVILLGPPFVITDPEIERVVDDLAESIATIAAADPVA